MIVLALAVLLAGDPSVKPWPIGPGPRYRPPAAQLSGKPIGSLRCETGAARFPVHVELFAHRRVIVLPAGIGRVRGCSYPARTRLPIGVVEVARGARVTVGDLFRLWGQPLAWHRLASFRSRSPVRIYIAGRRVRRDPATVRLTPRAQIVVELGAYVAPHRFFLFPRGRR
jgi:hypothetical protein